MALRLEIPRPRTFLQKMSLRTGAELITYLQVINKVSGVYGLLAIITGAAIDGFQLSMYVYSTLALVATCCLYRHIRLQSPFETLLLAHLYALDSVVNALYTALFGVAWFYTLAAHPEHGPVVPGQSGIADTAGFTAPKHNVSEVNVVAAPSPGVTAGQSAVAGGIPQDSAPGLGAGLGTAVFQSGSIMSISLISAFWALRVYFVLVLLAFARQCLRHHIASRSATAGWDAPSTMHTTAADLAANPFLDTPGWRGKLGRAMLSGAPRYWLAADADNDWQHSLTGRFRKATKLEQPVGFGERERRRRSGTGPPVPQLANLQIAR